MAKIKFYAVKKGRGTGVFKTWAECEQQVTGYNGAEYKGFGNEAEANNYLTGNNQVKNKPASHSDTIDIYIDGSFILGRYSWAFVAYRNDQEIYNEFGLGTNMKAAEMHNVAGELAAAMRAIKWAAENYPDLKAIVYHDYQGVSSWITGEWRAKNELTKKYVDFVTPFYKTEKFTFVKVVGHSGNIGNERADKLAGFAFKTA